MTSVIAGSQRRQRAVVPPRQIPTDVGNFRCDQVEVVEEPVRRRHDELSNADIFGQGTVCGAQYTDVVLEARHRIPGAMAWIGVDGQACRERQRTLLERLDAEQLIAQRFFDRRRTTLAAPRGQGHHKRGVSGSTAGAKRFSVAINSRRIGMSANSFTCLPSSMCLSPLCGSKCEFALVVRQPHNGPAREARKGMLC